MVKKAIFAAALALALTYFLPATQAATDHSGQIVKKDGLSTLYYVAEGKRYVFPNDKAFATWFSDFSEVVTIGSDELQALPLAGNVRYRPGVLLVKIQTDPKVYAVAKNGVLRWVKTEALAKKLYGDNWNQLIDDIPIHSSQTTPSARRSRTKTNMTPKRKRMIPIRSRKTTDWRSAMPNAQAPKNAARSRLFRLLPDIRARQLRPPRPLFLPVNANLASRLPPRLTLQRRS